MLPCDIVPRMNDTPGVLKPKVVFSVSDIEYYNEIHLDIESSDLNGETGRNINFTHP